MARVAVLGASGFLGKRVLRRLLSDGYSVHALSRRDTGKTHHALSKSRADLVSASVDELAAAFRGCQAIVNLVGIKREEGSQTFDAVHVRLVENIIEAARRAGVSRLIHVSVVVARPDRNSGYHDSKWRGERAVAAGGLDYTILRPGVIYGDGDDMLSHLSLMIRASSVFPIVGRGESKLQPVYVEDVALAVSRALERPSSIGRSIDVVGPEPLRLREIVERVTEGLGLSVRIMPTPAFLMRPAVGLMSAVTSNPLSTPAQLQMLIDGMTGDPSAMERELGVAPRPFTVEAIRDTVRACPRRPTIELRLGRTWPSSIPRAPLKLCLLLAVALGLLTGAFVLETPDVWTRLVTAIALLGPLGTAAIWNERRDLLKPVGSGVLLGIAGAALFYAPAWLFTRLDFVAGEAHSLYAWRGDHSLPFLLGTLLIAVTAEELFWHGAVTRLFSHSFSQATAVILGAGIFALWHLASGSWLLISAAATMGIIWSLLFVITRNLTAPLVCHLLWDILVFLIAPVA